MDHFTFIWNVFDFKIKMYFFGHLCFYFMQYILRWNYDLAIFLRRLTLLPNFKIGLHFFKYTTS